MARRIAKICAWCALALLALTLAAVAGVLHYRRELLAAVLEQVRARTGTEVVFARSTLIPGRRLALVLTAVRVRRNGSQLLTVDEVRVSLRYGSLLWRDLALVYALELDHPVLRMPATVQKASAALVPGALFDARLAGLVRQRLGQLASMMRELRLSQGAVEDSQGRLLLRGLDLKAHYSTRRPGAWRFEFNAPKVGFFPSAPALSGEVRVAVGGSTSDTELARGVLRVRGVRLSALHGVWAAPSGLAGATTSFVLDLRRGLTGLLALRVADFDLAMSGLRGPLIVGDCDVSAHYELSQDALRLSQLVLARGAEVLASAQADLAEWQGPNGRLRIAAGGVRIDLGRSAVAASALAGAPAELAAVARSVDAGALFVDQLSLEVDLERLRRDPARTLAAALGFKARLSGVSWRPAWAAELPPITDLTADLSYAQGRLTISRTSLTIGASRLIDLRSEVSVAPHLSRARYVLDAQARVDLDELHAMAERRASASVAAVGREFEKVRGMARLALTLRGEVAKGRPLAWPARYRLQLSATGIELRLRRFPHELVVRRIAAVARPGRLVVHTARLGMARAAAGEMVLEGAIGLKPGHIVLTRGSVELLRLRPEYWLAGSVDLSEVELRGPLSGRISVRGGPEIKDWLFEGRLRMGHGELIVDALRSPATIHAASLTLKGHSLAVLVPRATFEGHGASLTFTVPDWRAPRVGFRLFASHFEFQYIRPPEQRKHPHSSLFAHLPGSGEVEARSALLGNLPLSGASGRLSWGAGRWQLEKLKATVFGGRVAGEVSGDTTAHTLRVAGRAEHVNAAGLFGIFAHKQRPILEGDIEMTADLRGGTGARFMPTMEGKARVLVRHGVLRRLVLLSRLLGAVSLKTWLSARLPDPVVAGIPFDRLSADLTANKGLVSTRNLLLLGPAMNIFAGGEANLATRRIDLRAGVVPFNGLSWLAGKVPLVGQNLAGGTERLLAFYVNIRGPLDDPSVLPMPLTSVLEFIRETVTLPINVIAPDALRDR